MAASAHVNRVAEKQVDPLAKTTDQGVNEVTAGESALRHFTRHVGAYRSGQSDTSERYKDLQFDDRRDFGAYRWKSRKPFQSLLDT